MDSSVAITLGLGFALGLRHATEADHLVAVSAIVSERRSLVEAARVGGLWGLGHTAALIAAGFLVIVLGISIPERVANLLELGVAAMIVALGGRLLYVIFRGRKDVHVHAHTHDGAMHSHLHFHDAPGGHSIRSSHEGPHAGLAGMRPLFVGIVHGLAGSAALTLLVLARISRDQGALLGLVYLAVFGAGSIGGMALMSLLIGLPFSLAGFRRAWVPLRVFAGVVSAVFGVVYGWEILGRL